MANNNKHTGPNVPALRFPEFSGEWETIKLGDVLKLKGGYAFKSERFLDTGVPVIRISNLPQSSNSVNLSDCVYYESGNYQNYTVKNGDLLIAMSGATTGKTAIYRYNYPAYLNQRVGLFAPKEKVHNLFLYPIVESKTFISQLSSKLVAGAQPNISSQDIETIAVGLPSKEEQIKIAHLFELINQRIETQSKIIEELKTLRSALSESLYYDCDSFQEMSFNDVGECYSGLSGKSSEDFGSGYPFVPYTNIFANDVIDENQFEYVQIRENEAQNTVHYGDLLMTLSSETPEEVGIGSVYLGSESHLYLNSFAFGIHITRTDLVYPPYLSWLVSTKSFRKFILPFAQGSTRYNLQKTDFMKAKYRFPTLERQKTIYKLLSSYSSKIANEEKILDLYQFQKQGLLEQMFI